MNNFGNASPGSWANKDPRKKFNLSQLDCVFELHDVAGPAGSLEEDKVDVLHTPLMENITSRHPLAIDRLFRDEDLYLGDTSAACLDSQTLPRLFRNPRPNKKPIRDDNSVSAPKSASHEAALKELLCGEERLPRLSEYVCQCAGLPPNSGLTLPAYSPLSVFVNPTQGIPSRCTLKDLVSEVLRYTFQNIHDAMMCEEPAVPAPDQLPMDMVQEDVQGKNGSVVPLESELKSVEEDPSAQSMAMSDVDTVLSVKRKHKAWSAAEEQELLILMQKPRAETEWETLAKKLDRTVCSLHAKAKTLARQQQNLAQQPSSDEGVATYYDMISRALNSTKDRRASKEDILAIISKLYNVGRESVEKAVLQCLSKKFERCMGVYRLKDGVEVPSKDGPSMSVKEKLIFIMSTMLPRREGTLSQIRQMYQAAFKEGLDTKTSADGNQAVWEKTVSKTLLKCCEFDKSAAKTKYTFKRFLSAL